MDEPECHREALHGGGRQVHVGGAARDQRVVRAVRGDAGAEQVPLSAGS